MGEVIPEKPAIAGFIRDPAPEDAGLGLSPE
jgi:hypothetical protein